MISVNSSLTQTLEIRKGSKIPCFTLIALFLVVLYYYNIISSNENISTCSNYGIYFIYISISIMCNSAKKMQRCKNLTIENMYPVHVHVLFSLDACLQASTTYVIVGQKRHSDVGGMSKMSNMWMDP